jgi:hypothetical protein
MGAANKRCQTALHIAVLNEISFDRFKMLTKRVTTAEQVNAKDSNGRTAMRYA